MIEIELNSRAFLIDYSTTIHGDISFDLFGTYKDKKRPVNVEKLSSKNYYRIVDSIREHIEERKKFEKYRGYND